MFFRNKGLRMPLLITAVVLMLVMSVGGVFASQVMLNGSKVKVDSNNAQMKYLVTLTNNASANATDAIANGVFTESIAWCPGRTEIAYLTLTNDEWHPVEVSLALTKIDNGFGNYLTCAVIDPEKLSGATSWTPFRATATVLPGSGELPLLQKTMGPGESYTFAFAIHLDEGTPDTYQEKSMFFNFGMIVKADEDPDATQPPSQNNGMAR